MPHDLPPPILLADHTALDFLNSVGAPNGEDIEWLGTGEDLITWLETTGLISADQARSCLRDVQMRDLDAAARDAVALREWFRDFLADQIHRTTWDFDDADVEPVNRILRRGNYVFQLSSGKGDPELKGSAVIEHAGDLLFPIALEIADFLSTAKHQDTHICAGETCTFWFVDLTKNKKRRWCDMKICGNRAKVTAFRSRRAGKKS
ncbi:CGNR zinc finger domain-containing protein [Roseibium sp. Sym1]|uniref:CGNR zinc finger domain-containing protein n=1 Tax=Roseibium sp. Sym1 TaxID=3016006 RepID=UPI0022B41070|nr:CGNR zinc finger domain-containing protein [Roseibium sp. Sym1]